MKRNHTVQQAIGIFRQAMEQLHRNLPEKFTPTTTYTIGVSGGADSLALAAITTIVLRNDLQTQKVVAVIVDHNLQSGSDVVASKTRQQLQQLGITSTIKLAELENGSNLEMRARQARYQLLGETGDVLLLGHTIDDQAETVLLQLARSSGLSAIAGMPSWGNNPEQPKQLIWRPFLGLQRFQTETICHAFNLEYWQDPTNGRQAEDEVAKLKLRSTSELKLAPELEQELPKRSSLRQIVLPQLTKLFPGIYNNLARTAKLARLDDQLLWELSSHELTHAKLPLKEASAISSSLSIEALLELPLSLRYRVLNLWLNELPTTSVTFERLDQINHTLIENQGSDGLIIELEGGMQVIRKQCVLFALLKNMC